MTEKKKPRDQFPLPGIGLLWSRPGTRPRSREGVQCPSPGEPEETRLQKPEVDVTVATSILSKACFIFNHL